MPTKPYVVTVADVQTKTPGERTAAGVMMDDHFVRWTWFDAEGNLDASRPAYDEMIYVMEGEATWVVDDQQHSVGAGHVLYIPADVERSVLSGSGRMVEVLGGLPWGGIALAEHQIQCEYRDWVQHNP